MNKLFIIISVIAAGFLSGCVSSWTYSTGGIVRSNNGSFSVKTPVNWYMRQGNKSTLFTRNGTSLEAIVIFHIKWTDSLSNGYPIPSNILLHEIPEIILGEYCAKNQAFNLSIIDNSIALINRFPVARTSYRYTSPNSLTISGIMYCIPFVNKITVLCYEAESSHYYLKSIDDFLTMTNNIEIRKADYRVLPGIKILK